MAATLESTRDRSPDRRPRFRTSWDKAVDDYRATYRSAAGKDEATQGTTEATGVRSGVPTGAKAGTTASATSVATTPVTPAKGAKSGAGSDTEEDFENFSLCGLEDGSDWEDDGPMVRNRTCNLSAEDQARFRALLDQILSQDVGLLGNRMIFEPEDVEDVMYAVRPYLESEPILIEDLPFGINVIGDLHGQLFDLHRIFDDTKKDGKMGWEHKKFLFLGNYVSRGRQQLEVVMALFIIKMLRPDDIFLLRGNHEFLPVNLAHGFAKMINDYYEEETAEYLYFLINTTFCYLSVAAIVGNDYFCVHAGISPSYFTRRNMRSLAKPVFVSGEDPLVHDLVWSDPAEGLVGTCFNGVRGSSIFFGLDALALAMMTMQVKVLIRGHSRLQAGHQELWSCLYSVYSATDSRLTKNDGSVFEIDKDGKLTIHIMPYCPQRRIWEDKWRSLEGDEASTGEPKTECPDEELGNGSLMTM